MKNKLKIYGAALMLLFLITGIGFTIHKRSNKADVDSSEIASSNIQIQYMFYGRNIPGFGFYEGWSSRYYPHDSDLQYIIDNKNDLGFIKALRGGVNNSNFAIRINSSFGLFRIRDEPEVRLKSIIGSLVSVEIKERDLAEYVLVNLLASESDPIQLSVAGLDFKVLDLNGETDDRYMPVLLHSMSDTDAYGKSVILRSLGRFWKQEGVRDVALEYIGDISDQVRAAATGLLSVVLSHDISEQSSHSMLGTLLRLSEDTSADVRLSACYGLGLYKNVSGAMERLKALSEDADPAVRRASVRVIVVKMGSLDDSLPVLIKALSDNDILVVQEAIERLRQLGASARPALPFLEKLTRSTDYSIRMLAGEAIKEIAPLK